jgi:hypothetical protein
MHSCGARGRITSEKVPGLHARAPGHVRRTMVTARIPWIVTKAASPRQALHARKTCCLLIPANQGISG